MLIPLSKKTRLLSLIFVSQLMITSAIAKTTNKPMLTDTLINQIPQINRPQVIEQDISQHTNANELENQTISIEELSNQSNLQSAEDALLISILQAMKQQEWQKAKSLLASEVNKNNTNMHLLFLAGQVEEQLGNYQSAIDYYRLMLATKSDLARPRFELARMQYHLKQMQQAESNFRLVLAQSLPQAVVVQINHYLNAIKKQKTSWQIGVNILPSTNINNGSDNDTVIINGKDFVLSEDAKAKSGIGVRGFLAGQYQFGSELQWFVDGAMQITDYPNKTNDSTFLRSRIGHTWRQSDQRIKASLGYQGMQHQHHQLYTGWVTSLGYQKELTQNSTLNTTLEWQKLDYVEDYDYLDATQTWLNMNINHYKDGNTMYQYGVRAGKNSTDDPTENYQNLAIEFDAMKQLNWLALTTNTGVSFNSTQYEAENPFFATKRQDKRWNIHAGVLKRDWSWLGFTPKISVNHEINNSNIPRYEHSNTSLDIALTQNF